MESSWCGSRLVEPLTTITGLQSGSFPGTRGNVQTCVDPAGGAGGVGRSWVQAASTTCTGAPLCGAGVHRASRRVRPWTSVTDTQVCTRLLVIVSLLGLLLFTVCSPKLPDTHLGVQRTHEFVPSPPLRPSWGHQIRED